MQRLIASSNSSPSSPGDLRATLDALLLHSPAGAAVGADAGASPAPEQQHDLVPIVQTVRSASLQVKHPGALSVSNAQEQAPAS